MKRILLLTFLLVLLTGQISVEQNTAPVQGSQLQLAGGGLANSPIPDIEKPERNEIGQVDQRQALPPGDGVDIEAEDSDFSPLREIIFKTACVTLLGQRAPSPQQHATTPYSIRGPPAHSLS